jgi:hypothetical protein
MSSILARRNKPPMKMSDEMIKALDEAQAKKNTCFIRYFKAPPLDYDWSTSEGQALLEQTYHLHFGHIADEALVRLVTVQPVHNWSYEDAIKCLQIIRDYYVHINPNCYANPEQFWDLSPGSPCMQSLQRYQEKALAAFLEFRFGS